MSYEELMKVDDLYENDELVLMKAYYSNGTVELSLGFKDESGDIEEIIDVKQY